MKFLILPLVFFLAVLLTGMSGIFLDPAAGKINMCGNAGVLNDAGGGIGYDEAFRSPERFLPCREDSFNFGYTHSAFWIRGIFTNSVSGRWVLSTEFPWFNSFDLYLTGRDGKTLHVSQVKKQPFRTRAIVNRNFCFPLELQAGRTEFLIRVTGNPLHFHLDVVPENKFFDSSTREYILLGIYYGVFILIFLASLVLYLRIREPSYIYVSLFIASMGLLQFTLNGLSFQYLWPEFLSWHEISSNFLPGLTILIGSFMARKFLETPKNTPVLDKILYFFQAVSVLCMVFAVMNFQTLCQVLINIMMIGIPLLFTAMGAVCLKKGFFPARYFLMTFIVQSVLLVVYALREQGILQHNTVTEYGIQVAVLVQVLFLVLAMFDRVNLTAKEKQKLHQQMLFNLEKRVKERTHELEMYATTDTMTGIYNRRIGLLLLEEEIHKAKRNKSVLTICFIDINDLKNVNDNFGHKEGDDLILSVVGVLKESLRESDIICRMGGDEFLIIMLNCSLNQSLEVWKGIQEKIRGLNAGILKSYNVSVSRGFAEFNPIYPVTLDELIATADYQMYQHKKLFKIP